MYYGYIIIKDIRGNVNHYLKKNRKKACVKLYDVQPTHAFKRGKNHIAVMKFTARTLLAVILLTILVVLVVFLLIVLLVVVLVILLIVLIVSHLNSPPVYVN